VPTRVTRAALSFVILYRSTCRVSELASNYFARSRSRESMALANFRANFRSMRRSPALENQAFDLVSNGGSVTSASVLTRFSNSSSGQCVCIYLNALCKSVMSPDQTRRRANVRAEIIARSPPRCLPLFVCACMTKTSSTHCGAEITEMRTEIAEASLHSAPLIRDQSWIIDDGTTLATFSRVKFSLLTLLSSLITESTLNPLDCSRLAISHR